MSNYFYGWYFRCQGKDGVAAIIPAVHLSSKKRCCSIQVISQNESLYQEFSIHDFRIDRRKGILKIGENLFSRKGIRIGFEGRKQESGRGNPETGERMSDEERVVVHGYLRFGEFTVPKYDIMGPFTYIPGMECRHTVYSMRHTVDGELVLGNTRITFQNGMGYMEGDRGTSFPDQYIWTQHFLPQGSMMFAAASVPLAGLKFMGTLGYIYYEDREYRFATYLGASVKRMRDGELRIRQGRYRLHIRFSELEGRALKAPDNGNMTRIVRENVACGVEYTWFCGDRICMHIQTDKAAAEYDELPV